MDVLDPPALRKGFPEEPERDGQEEAYEEEEVEGGVMAELAKDSQGPDEAPDDGGVVEDVAAGACPWTPRGKLGGVADMLHSVQEQPRRSVGDGSCDHTAGKLRFLIARKTERWLDELSCMILHETKFG